jgi:predicted RND superfamily exporter protein
MTFDVPFVRKATDTSPLPFQKVLEIVRDELEAQAPHLKATASGPGAFQMAFRKALEADMLLTLAGLVVILVLCRFALGTWRSGVVLCGLIAILGTFVFAVLSACGIAIDPLNNGLLLMVSVAGVQDYLFIGLSRVQASTLTEKLARTALPCFLTSVTTAVGFGALGVSDLAIIREFGLVAGGAAALEWLLMFVCLPAFDSLGWLKLSHVEPGWMSRPTGFALGIDGLLRKSLPRTVALACIGMLVFGLYSLRDLSVNDDLKSFFDASHPFRTSLADMKLRRGFEGSISLRTDISDRDAVTRVYAQLAALPEVSGVLSPVEVLAFVTKDARDPVQARALETLALEAPAMEPWFNGEAEASGRLFVKDIELASLTRLLKRVRSLCKTTCEPYGSMVTYEEYSSTIIPSLFRSLSVAFLFVTLTLGWLAWRSRQLTRLPQILAGSFWGPLTLIGLFFLLDMPVNFVTSIFGSVLVGITGDNGIQYLLSGHDDNASFESGVDAKGVASFVASIAIAAIALLFCFSSFSHMRSLGALFAVGFALSFFGDVWLAKVRWRQPQRRAS